MCGWDHSNGITISGILSIGINKQLILKEGGDTTRECGLSPQLYIRIHLVR